MEINFMPTTVVALIIILFAILPGVPAHKIFRAFIGTDWRETDWEKIISIIGFSTGGLLIYTIISSFTRLPLPIYVVPSTFDSTSFGTSSLLPIAASLSGHFVSSALAALLTALGIRFVARWTPTSPYPAAWDDFIRVDVQKHWVVVRLTNGEAYAGIVKNVDISVSQAERDIVLAEPAKYMEKENNYKVIPYQQLFLPAALVFSIAVVHNPEIDRRITTIGSTLFSKEVDNARE
jgi:hypothetical protein